MPATTKKQVDPSHTIEYQRTVINDMAGDLQSIFTGTAAINAATIQVAGSDIGAISDHDDKTIFYYYGAFNVDASVSSPAKISEILSHEDATVDIADGVTVTVDDGCSLTVTDTTAYEFFTTSMDKTNPQKLVGFADNIRTSVVKDMSLDGKKKVGYFVVPDHLQAVSYKLLTVTNAVYTETTGEMVLTIDNHGIKVGETLKIDAGSLIFTCAKDDHATNHSYPRSTDTTAYNKKLTVSAVTSTTVTVNVGKPSTYTKSVTAATYDPATGVMVLTIGTHDLKQGGNIQIPDGSLKFTCAQDSHNTQHPYPRSSDPKSGKDIFIGAVGTGTITVNVGISPNVTDHTFVSGSITYKEEHVHRFVSAATMGISSGGEQQDDVTIDIDDTFTLTVDDQAVVII